MSMENMGHQRRAGVIRGEHGALVEVMGHLWRTRGTSVGAEGLGVREAEYLRYTMSLLASGPIAEQDRFSGLTMKCLRPESPSAFFSHIRDTLVSCASHGDLMDYYSLLTPFSWLDAGQVAFHTADTELWKDRGLATQNNSGIYQPTEPLGLNIHSTRFRICLSQRHLPPFLLTLPLTRWPAGPLPHRSTPSPAWP